jgi:hypothetical protein
MSIAQMHLENGIPGAKAFQVYHIQMAAEPIHIPHIKDFVHQYPSFLKIKAKGHRVNWRIYFASTPGTRDNLNEILLASGILSLEPLDNLSIRDAGSQERFFGPTLHRDRLFFHRDALEHAREFLRRKTDEMRSAFIMPAQGIEIAQMTQRAEFVVIESELSQ